MKKNIKRYNTFYYSHKGLRGILYSVGLEIQKTDFDNVEERQELLARLEEVLNLFERHSLHEDLYIFPSVIMHDKSMVVDLERDHLFCHELSTSLLKLVAELRLNLASEVQEELGKKLFYTFNKFIAFHLEHMEKEEKNVNNVLWRYYTDDEIIQMKNPILNFATPTLLLQEVIWTLRSISLKEIVSWLEGMKARVPEETLERFIQLTKQELPLKRWQEIEQQVIKLRLN